MGAVLFNGPNNAYDAAISHAPPGIAGDGATARIAADKVIIGIAQKRSG